MKTIWKELRDTPAAFHQELRSFSVREERFQFALWRCASVVMAIGIATLLQLDVYQRQSVTSTRETTEIPLDSNGDEFD